MKLNIGFIELEYTALATDHNYDATFLSVGIPGFPTSSVGAASPDSLGTASLDSLGTASLDSAGVVIGGGGSEEEQKDLILGRRIQGSCSGVEVRMRRW